nr:hypothetical protein [Tanacetum cinerariifolium]
MLSSTGVALVFSASGSQSQDNTKKNRIRRTHKKAKETELEEHLRNVKSSLNKAGVVDSRATSPVVSRHQKTQQYGAILPIELTTADIRNSKAYKEYHACAMGGAAPKPKASARKKKGNSASSTTPPTPTPTTTVESAPRLSANAKGKQPSRETTPVEPTDVQRTEAEQLKIEELSWKSSDDEDVGSHEEGKKSDDRDEGSDNDSDETIKSGAGKDDDDDDDE